MKPVRGGLGLLIAFAATFAAAQGATPAKKELIAKVMQHQAAGIESIGQQLAVQPLQPMLTGANQALGRLPAEQRETLGKEIEAEVRKYVDEVGPLLRSTAAKIGPTVFAPALEERFSEDELRTLVAWLESPVSRKFQELSAPLPPQIAQKVVEQTRATVEPKLRALDASLGRKLGVPAPAPAASAPRANASAPRK